MKKLDFLLNAIAAGDYAFQFAESKGRRKQSVNRALNRIKDILAARREEIKRQEEYFGVILDAARTGVMVIDRGGAVLQVNRETLRLLRLDVLTHVKQLARVDPAFVDIFANLAAGENRRVNFTDEKGEVTLSVRCSVVELKEREMKLVALSEIGGELASQEVETWARLTRVLTHEIMNSVSPITSLAETLVRRPDLPADVRSGLQTIHSTGRGLSDFVESYRNLTRLPQPRPTLIDVKPMLERAARLAEGEHATSISISISVEVAPDDMILHADENLIFQVVVNLLKNAAQTGADKITVAARCPAGEQVTIAVTNNGPEIPPDVLPNIFIPFFTTKETGSGIGLSISRQIMRLHGGSLTVRSTPEATTFSLIFP